MYKSYCAYHILLFCELCKVVTNKVNACSELTPQRFTFFNQFYTIKLFRQTNQTKHLSFPFQQVLKYKIVFI